MLLTVAAFRTPIIALMPDLVPSALRSKANGVINLMGGLVALAAVGVLLWQVKEPRGLVASATEGDEGLGIFAAIRNIPRENARSLTLLILAIFFFSRLQCHRDFLQLLRGGHPRRHRVDVEHNPERRLRHVQSVSHTQPLRSHALWTEADDHCWLDGLRDVTRCGLLHADCASHRRPVGRRRRGLVAGERQQSADDGGRLALRDLPGDVHGAVVGCGDAGCCGGSNLEWLGDRSHGEQLEHDLLGDAGLLRTGGAVYAGCPHRGGESRLASQAGPERLFEEGRSTAS